MPRLRTAQSSTVHAGHVHPAGTPVTLLNILSVSRPVWLVEIALPRPDLVGGKEFEVLELHVRDLLFDVGYPPGLHIAAIGVTVEQCKALRREGLEYRDTILVMTEVGAMLVALLRSPMEGTLIEQIARTERGAVHVDACRVGATSDYGRSAANATGTIRAHEGFGGKAFKIAERDGAYANPGGRWPPNAMFVHADGCRCDGTKQVKSVSGGPSGYNTPGNFLAKRYAPTLKPSTRFTDEDGTETVASWICAPDCPVRMLDEQSEAMGVHSAGTARDDPGGGSYDGSTGIGFAKNGSGMGVGRRGFRIGDVGGASRFFPTFGAGDDWKEWFSRLVALGPE